MCLPFPIGRRYRPRLCLTVLRLMVPYLMVPYLTGPHLMGQRLMVPHLMGQRLMVPHLVDPVEPVASVEPMRYWNTDTKQPLLRRRDFASW
jgi:hypothetical protein